MIYLLDTHTLLWWFSKPEKLSKKSQEVIGDSKNIILVSSVSTWEIVIKKTLGKLRVPDRIFSLIEEENFYELPIRISHTQALEKLPKHHNDPFDRLLIAQGNMEKAVIITRDKYIKKYPISTIEA